LAPASALFVVRKFNPRAGFGLAILAGIIFALNETFVSYSTEFKPYVLETCVHVAAFYVWVSEICARQPIGV
jgi:hypothetical protein